MGDIEPLIKGFGSKLTSISDHLYLAINSPTSLRNSAGLQAMSS